MFNIIVIVKVKLQTMLKIKYMIKLKFERDFTVVFDILDWIKTVTKPKQIPVMKSWPETSLL